MKSFTEKFAYLLTIAVLMSAAILMGTNRLEYCGQAESLTMYNNSSSTTEMEGPTLAPPQNVVFVRVESDHSDLQIGWIKD